MLFLLLLLPTALLPLLDFGIHLVQTMSALARLCLASLARLRLALLDSLLLPSLAPLHLASIASFPNLARYAASSLDLGPHLLPLLPLLTRMCGFCSC